MGDHLFQRVGHTDEGTASLGGNPALWSPFHPDYNPREGLRQQAAEAREMSKNLRGGVRTNPPTATPAVAEALNYAAARLEDAAKGKIASVFSSHTVLALGGFIVNRSWGEALELCNRMIDYATKAGQIKVVRKPGAAPKAMLMTDSKSGIYAKLKAVQQYLVCLDQGMPPVRAGSKGRTVSLFDDVRDCCIVETGNVKLPFVAYSEIPVVTCPGAGGVNRFPALTGKALGTAKTDSTGQNRSGCATYCYSLKVFGKPSVVFRMLINTLGFSANAKTHVAVVVEEVLRTQKKMLRLFVDGDFRSEEAVFEWMHGIKVLGTHGVKVYGYSKSWEEFLNVNRDCNQDGRFWPRNYALNLSGGSRHSKALKNRMAKVLDWREAGGVVRGEFNAVQVLERLCWKSAGLVVGKRLWDTFTKATNEAKTSSSIFKKARKQLIADLRQAESVNPEVLSWVARKPGRVPPTVAYEAYVKAAHSIKKHVRGYNAYAAKKAGGATEAQPLQLAPGQAVQAMTWNLLKDLAQEKEFSCPISCGNCPQAMIYKHEDTIGNLFGEKHKEIMASRKDAIRITDAVAAKGTSVHACGDQRIRWPIIIGLH